MISGLCTYTQSISGYTEVLQPGEPVNDGFYIHQQTCKDLHK